MNQKRAIGMMMRIGVITSLSPPTFTVGSPPTEGETNMVGVESRLMEKIGNALPRASSRVEAAMNILDQDWDGMSSEERDLFLKFFDPGKSGEVDEDFIQEVRANYQKVHSDLQTDITFVYETEAKRCVGMRLFLTDFRKIHICPYVHET